MSKSMQTNAPMRARMKNKHKTEYGWYLDTFRSNGEKYDDRFIPFDGELIIYDAEIEEEFTEEMQIALGRTGIFNYPRFKFGNGKDDLWDLPFAGSGAVAADPTTNALSLVDGDAIGEASLAVGTNKISETSPLNEYVQRDDQGNSIFNVPTALADGSISLGISNQSGVKGYYWYSCTKGADNLYTFLISMSQSNLHQETEGVNLEDWQVGDYLSVINENKFYFWTTIVEIDTLNSAVKVAELPYKWKSDIPRQENMAQEEFAIFAIGRTEDGNFIPRSGGITFGFGAFSTGFQNASLGAFSNTFGRNNIAAGDYAFTFGKHNVAGYAAIVGGWDNFILGEKSIVMGKENFSATEADNSIIVGTNNKTDAPNIAIFGAENEALRSANIEGIDPREVRGSIITGAKNNVQDIYNAVFGDLNTLTYNADTGAGGRNLVSGHNNNNTGNFTLITGRENINIGNWNAVVGYNNQLNGDSNFVSGKGHIFIGKGNVVGGLENKGPFQEQSTGIPNNYNLCIGKNNGVEGNYNIQGGCRNDIVGHGNFVSGGAITDSGEGLLGNQIKGRLNFVAGGYYTGDGAQKGNSIYGNYNFMAGGGNVVASPISGSNGHGNAIFGIDNEIYGSYNMAGGQLNRYQANNSSGSTQNGYSLVFGYKNTVKSQHSFVLGRENTLVGKNLYCFVTGYNNNIIEEVQGASAFGIGHKVNGNYQFLIGAYSDTDTNKELAFAIGNGTTKAPKNTFSIDKSGNVYTMGRIHTAGYVEPIENGDLISLGYFEKHLLQKAW